MNFELSDEQQQLADSLGKYLVNHYGFEQRKAIVHSDGGLSDEVWRTFAEMGLTAIALPEADGGFGGGAIDLMAAMEACGEALVVEPLAETIVAARLLARAGSAAQRAAVLPGVIDGSVRLALACLEPGRRYDTDPQGTQAQRQGEGWLLTGHKAAVVGAPQARHLLVTARTDAGPALFLVDTATPGVGLNPSRGVDGVRLATVHFVATELPAAALVAQGEGVQALIDEAVDFATALACAEAVGAMTYANETTLEYMKTRKQFGVAIASFQVLQHRIVECVIATEQARSMAILACDQVDHAPDAAARMRAVSAAKVKIADAARQVSQESVQLHGGMGMTEELKVSHTFRRLTTLAQRHGDADHHLERYAALG